MVLAVDIGNTSIVIGGFDSHGSILFKEKMSTAVTATDFEYAVIIRNVLDICNVSADDIEGAIISSVVPFITNTVKTAVRRITGCESLVVGPGIKTGLSIRIDDPAQLGSDLVAGAVAGIHEYPLPLAIIDMGTATIISVIDKNKCYIGGMIMPGIKVSAEALTSKTSQLPRVALDEPKRLIGKNTVECMKSGMLYGNAACIDGVLDRISDELGDEVTAVASGGSSAVIARLCKRNIIVDDDLMLKGLMLIYNKNK